MPKTGTVIGIIVVLAILGVATGIIPNPFANTNQPAGLDQCSITPSFSVTGLDALVANQNVTPASYSYRVNNVYVGTSYSPIKNAKVEILATAPGYLATEGIVNQVICDKNEVALSFKNYANASITIKQDAKYGASALTNDVAGGAVNATTIGAGSSASLPIIIEGTSQKSTGNVLMTVEFAAGSAQNISSVSLNGFAQATIPNCITSNNANSYRVGFIIPAIDGFASNTHNLGITTSTGKQLAGGVYTTYYPQNKFVETNGNFVEGVCDLNNVAKYNNTYSYNFLIK
jgi:hypothetical protein